MIGTGKPAAQGMSRRGMLAATAGIALGAMGAAPRSRGAAAQEATPEGDCRVIVHTLGEACVPREPQRVVALGSAVDVALAVGITPVGIDARSAGATYLGDRVTGIPTVGLPWEPNLEAIAALEPDLILALDIVIEEVYPELAAIGPTVGVEFGETSGNWKDFNRGFAQAMAREAAFDEAAAAYEAKAERLRSSFADQLGEFEVAILRASPDNLRFDLPGIFIGAVVYGDAGLGLPPGLADHHAATPGDFTLSISPEEFTIAESADALFVWQVSGDAAEDEAAIAEILENPLLRRLEAVAQGRAYGMGDHWFSETYLGADLVLDDLERTLLGEDA